MQIEQWSEGIEASRLRASILHPNHYMTANKIEIKQGVNPTYETEECPEFCWNRRWRYWGGIWIQIMRESKDRDLLIEVPAQSIETSMWSFNGLVIELWWGWVQREREFEIGVERILRVKKRIPWLNYDKSIYGFQIMFKLKWN